MYTANNIDEISSKTQETKTGLITTKGYYQDVSEPSNDSTYDLFNTQTKQHIASIDYHSKREISEHINHSGEIINGLNFDEIENILQDFKAEGINTIVISLLHSNQNNDHECAIAYYIKKYHPNFSVTYSTE